jgi:hypothetical protein
MTNPKPGIIEDRNRCDHPFESLRLYSAKEYNAADSMATVASTFAAIVFCEKCQSFILMNSDYCSWNESLYSKLVLSLKNIIPHDEYPFYRGNDDPDEDQTIFFNNIKWIVDGKQHDCMMKPEILEWIWKNHPDIMSKFISMINEAAVKAIKK